MGQPTIAPEERVPEAWDAGHDSVTGLLDHSAWEPRLLHELDRAAFSGRPLCVAIVDLDNLKAVNEEHGRLAGDSLLRRATDSWLRSIRSTDLLVRLDAHKFGVVLPDCTPCTADRVLDRMREAMPEGQTFSAGIAPWEAGETTTELDRRAHEALRTAKSPGCAPVQVAGMPGQPEAHGTARR
jgi:diguanylate cyclase (GGDEF)-like protein